MVELITVGVPVLGVLAIAAAAGFVVRRFVLASGGSGGVAE